MTTLQLTLPTDLEQELSRIRPDLETVVLEAIRQFVATRIFVANDLDIENAAVQDNTDDLLTPQELTYYFSLE